VTSHVEHTCSKYFHESDKCLTAKSIVLSSVIRVNLLLRVSHVSTILYCISSSGLYAEISVNVIHLCWREVSERDVFINVNECAYYRIQNTCLKRIISEFVELSANITSRLTFQGLLVT
jgi:hypothetical protein